MDVTAVADEKYVYLTTRGHRTGKPHTVELWFAAVGDRVYLSHEGKHTDWMRNILKDNRVEFRVRGLWFRGRAKIMRSGEEFEIGKWALYLKYYGEASKDVIDDWFSESSVIEISMIEKDG